MTKDLSLDDFKQHMEQHIFWRIPCTMYSFKGRADVVMSHVKSKSSALSAYEAIDIRIRRTSGHRLGPGFSTKGIRLKMEEAVSLWKALGYFLNYIDEEGE